MNACNCPHCGRVIVLMKPEPVPVERTQEPTSQQAAPASRDWVEVAGLVKCNRCGGANLAWQKSRLGKSYLCVGREENGRFYANRRQFHNCR
jgi:hypothetical protein